ncbi:hypothetical protein R3P38DRAFT_3219037 [Favolaschia claudopus]|uniref:Uncharacterized protein n=1 Tax=Favolaschia claudopus TaxID=2862362 RepID=A0AAW0A2L8_9AGAR
MTIGMYAADVQGLRGHVTHPGQIYTNQKISSPDASTPFSVAGNADTLAETSDTLKAAKAQRDLAVRLPPDRNAQPRDSPRNRKGEIGKTLGPSQLETSSVPIFSPDSSAGSDEEPAPVRGNDWRERNNTSPSPRPGPRNPALSRRSSERGGVIDTDVDMDLDSHPNPSPSTEPGPDPENPKKDSPQDSGAPSGSTPAGNDRPEHVAPPAGDKGKGKMAPPPFSLPGINIHANQSPAARDRNPHLGVEPRCETNPPMNPDTGLGFFQENTGQFRRHHVTSSKLRRGIAKSNLDCANTPITQGSFDALAPKNSIKVFLPVPDLENYDFSHLSKKYRGPISFHMQVADEDTANHIITQKFFAINGEVTVIAHDAEVIKTAQDWTIGIFDVIGEGDAKEIEGYARAGFIKKCFEDPRIFQHLDQLTQNRGGSAAERVYEVLSTLHAEYIPYPEDGGSVTLFWEPFTENEKALESIARKVRVLRVDCGPYGYNPKNPLGDPPECVANYRNSPRQAHFHSAVVVELAAAETQEIEAGVTRMVGEAMATAVAVEMETHPAAEAGDTVAVHRVDTGDTTHTMPVAEAAMDADEDEDAVGGNGAMQM